MKVDLFEQDSVVNLILFADVEPDGLSDAVLASLLFFVPSLHLDQGVGVVCVASMRIDQGVMRRTQQNQVLVPIDFIARIVRFMAWSAGATGSDVRLLADDDGEFFAGSRVNFIRR